MFSGFNPDILHPSELFTPAFCPQPSQESVCVTLTEWEISNTVVLTPLSVIFSPLHSRKRPHGSSRCSPGVDLDVGDDELLGLTSFLEFFKDALKIFSMHLHWLRLSLWCYVLLLIWFLICQWQDFLPALVFFFLFKQISYYFIPISHTVQISCKYVRVFKWS